MSQDVRLQIVTGRQGAAGAAGAPGAPGAAGAGGNAAGVSLFEDFLGTTTTAAGVVSYGGVLTLRGSVAGNVGGKIDKTFPGDLIGHPGILALRTGASDDATVSLFGAGATETSAFAAGGGEITFEMLAHLTAASAPAGQRYHLMFGLSTVIDGTVDDNGIAWMEYGQKLDDSGAVNGGKILLHSLDQTLDSGFTPSAATWTKYKIVVAEDGSQAEFFVDGDSVGVIELDLSGIGCTVMVTIQKLGGGTSNRACNIDYLSLTLPQTAER